MNPASDKRHLGEYRLRDLVSENAVSRTWLAEQVSISRRVLVDELRPECLAQKETFLADVRAKALVDHPLIGSIYEAVAESEHCFCARELLPGTTLEDARKAGEPLPPARLAHVLQRLAEAQIHHETLGQATLPPDLENIHLDGQDVIRIDNLAVAGARSAGQSAQDIARLGDALLPLVAADQPATKRMLTLLAWMCGEGLERPLDWLQVHELCCQIQAQLAEADSATPSKEIKPPRKTTPRWLVGFGGSLALLALLGLARHLRPVQAQGPSPAQQQTSVLIPDGRHKTQDGMEEDLKAFRISPHEVTIGQYAAFLEILQTLSKNELERTFDHVEQPREKTSHLPDDWTAMLAAATAGGLWNQRPVSLDNPVVSVDWWDAAAYAEWKKARLPSQEEWFAALRMQVEMPAAIPASDWLPVTAETTDRTPPGMLGMAGSVCEWTRLPAADPSNPLGERKWVIVGGSFLKPGSNALSREWTADRSLRRPDLGFRVVFDAD